MKQIIPFVREIEFENNIANVVSISLEHDYSMEDVEITGEFLVYGEYKTHNDTTEIKEFNERIPFNLIIPDNLIRDSIHVDIDDFTYEIINDKKIKVCIDLFLIGEEINNKDDVRDLKDIWGLNNEIKNETEYEILNEVHNVTNEDNDIVKVKEDNDNVYTDIKTDIDDINIGNKIEEYAKVDNTIDKYNNIDNNVSVNTTNNIEINQNNILNQVNNDIEEVGEYIIYHIHIVNEGDTLESIINKYDTNIDILKEYNDVSKLDVGTKLIIPEVYYGNN